MFALLVLLYLCSFSQGRPTAFALGRCHATSSCRVSLPTVESALETFLCLAEEDYHGFTEEEKKRLLAQTVSQYLHVTGQEIEEMDPVRIAGLANLVLHNLDDSENIQKRSEEEYIDQLMRELADKTEMDENTFRIIDNPIILAIVNCRTQQLFNLKSEFRKISGVRDMRGFQWFPKLISLSNAGHKGDIDEKLSRNIEVKYFNKLNKDLGDSWEKGGQTIRFSGSQITFQNEATFLPDVKTVFTAHGFLRDATYFCDEFIQNYVEAGMDVQVICINWKNLANLLKSSGLLPMMLQFGGMYKGEAQYAVLTGWWLGRLLHHLVEATGLHHDNVHLIGFSLGAHLVGMMGTTFSSLAGNRVGRVTGLDPAGPLFAQDIFDLHKYCISTDSGAFVDIIHTNGGFSDNLKGLISDGVSVLVGDMRALGHADFYPNGGQRQKVKGCLFDIDLLRLKSGIINFCNHNSAVRYYLESILLGPTGFPASPCSSPKTCSEKTTTSTDVSNHMGEFATKPTSQDTQTYYLDLTL